MNTTRSSLLERLRDPSDEIAWREFDELYSPLMRSYARARGLDDDDASEVASESMALLIQKMPNFEYDRKKGKFRGLLRRIVNNKITDKQRRKPVQDGFG